MRHKNTAFKIHYHRLRRQIDELKGCEGCPVPVMAQEKLDEIVKKETGSKQVLSKETTPPLIRALEQQRTTDPKAWRNKEPKVQMPREFTDQDG
jgi:hypothetical protein